MGYIASLLLIAIGFFTIKSGNGKGAEGLIPAMIGVVVMATGFIVLIVSITRSFSGC